MSTIRAILAAGALASSAAFAATSMQIDVNSVAAQARNSGGVNSAFGGLTHTGSVVLTSDPITSAVGFKLDEISQVLGSTLQSFSATVNLVNGGVTGGNFSVLMADGSSYIATIQGGQGRVTTQAGQGFKFSGLTFTGVFSGPAFASVALGQLFPGPLSGSFLVSAFDPNANGLDTTTNVELFAAIPTPMAAGMGAAGLLVVAGARRRRA